MPSRFHIRVSNDRLVFSAAHFVTIGETICERLHGHNYRVAAEVAGQLDENRFVIDFIVLREALEKIIGTLDHFVLLPTRSKLIHVSANEQTVEATFDQRRWVLPRGDCVLLPIANTTAEQLAEFIGQQLKEELQRRLSIAPPRVRVEVEESCGMIGVCELTDDSSPSPLGRGPGPEGLAVAR
jgi:6-pyruvoyltetrahydropterin/6-carboxytetrahydropterin synthase